jgi:sugar lactone lactonase YvrE
MALVLLLLPLAGACNLNTLGITMAPGWQAHSIAAWRHTRPDMMVFSADGKWLYITCENRASLLSPSLVAINMESGRSQILLYGLMRADALKMAPDGSLWLGEEFDKGLIWRISEPDKLPEEQRVDRSTLESSHRSISPMYNVGTFSHEGLTFSHDGRYAYLADEWEEGCLYRYDNAKRQLAVLHGEKGWLPIPNPDDARIEAEKLHGRMFNRVEDMETLPDGRILFAETATGRIMMLDDRGKAPVIRTYLTQPSLKHPDNLAWDPVRKWLWITDDDEPSYLWAWDGRELREIAHDDDSEITGVITRGETVYINTQRKITGTELTLRLTEKR